MPYFGEIAALLTSVSWSCSAVLFSWSGRRIGSRAVNLTRLFAALLLAMAVHLVLFGSPAPVGAQAAAWGNLTVSGLIGFAIGDAVLFEALVLLGPRMSMLIMTLSPIFTAILAWVFLNQSLSVMKLISITATVCGIAWVVGAQMNAQDFLRPKRLWAGILLASGGALAQSVGLLFSNFGLKSGIHPLSANLIRLSAGALGLLIWCLMRGRVSGVLGKLRDRTATAQVVGGAAVGPVIGVTLSLISIRHAPMGVAATLMSLSPLILLPVTAWLDREPITMSSVLGTVLSMLGTAGLFLL
jgi:drug/metabolite transporter (DMT)-like permease